MAVPVTLRRVRHAAHVVFAVAARSHILQTIRIAVLTFNQFAQVLGAGHHDPSLDRATRALIPTRVLCASHLSASDIVQALTEHNNALSAFDAGSIHGAAEMGGSAAWVFQTVLAVAPASDPQTLGNALHQMNVQSDVFVPYTDRALLLSCQMGADSATLSARYDARSLNARQMSRFLGQLGCLIQRIQRAAENLSDLSVAELGAASAADRLEIASWSSSGPPATTDSCIHDIIAQKAAEAPERPAVFAWDGEWSYAGLDRVSSRLAGHLQSFNLASLGSGQAVVPLCFEKSKWAVVAVLAVLKAGLAFTLIDPSNPPERIARICKQTSATMALTSRGHCTTITGAHLGHIIVVDDQLLESFGPVSTDDKDGFKCIAKPQDLAYVIFTSGSTGEPKGSMIEHRGFASCSLEFGPAFGIDSRTRALQFASYAFGACLMEILTTLMHGGCVCIPSEDDRMNDIPGFIGRAEVNWALFTPSYIGAIEPQSVPGLQTLVLVGEPMSADIRDVWASRVQLLFGYGQSESSTACSVARVCPETNHLNNIGRGVGARLWITDPDDVHKLAPIGSIGELIVESPGVARGYIVSPPQDESPFLAAVPCWWQSVSQRRQSQSHDQNVDGNVKFYRTGDLVHYRSDGAVAYLGRRDSQVKIRGQRVELGDVESHLRRQFPSNVKVVVDVLKRPSPQSQSSAGDTVLVAFLIGPYQVGTDDKITAPPRTVLGVDVSILETSAFQATMDVLRQSIPEYSIPSYYIWTKHLPTTTTGKADRKKLRSIGAELLLGDHILPQNGCCVAKHKPEEDASHSTAAQLPREQLRSLWFRSLNLECESLTIPHDASFFQLGGDSIAAIKLVNMAKMHNMTFSVADILQNPFLDGLATVISARAAAAAQSSAPPRKPIVPTKSHGPVAQSFAQGRLWFVDMLNPDASWYYIIPLAVRLRGPLNTDALAAAQDALEQRHESLRTTFQEQDGVGVQIIHDKQNRKALRVIDMSAEPDSHIDYLRRDHTTPFNLASEPAWRVSLLRLGKNDHVLSIVMHHIVSDGWSVDLLAGELNRFYQAALRGEDPLSQVRPLAIQYRDFAVWQRQHAQVEEHERQLEYWRRQLDGAQPASLLCDKPRPPVLSGSASMIELVIDGPTYQSLQDFSRAQQSTLFVVLLAVFRAAHFRLTAAEDVTIGTPIANRTDPELEGIIGLFVNTQCMRIAVQAEDSLISLVQQIRSTVTAALEHQDVPFDRIVSALQPGVRRDASRNPLVQLMFVLHSQKDLGKIELDGLDCTTLLVDPMTRFDLEFHLFKEEGRLRGTVLFAKDLFELKTIHALVNVFQEILRRCLQQPEAPIATVPLTSGQDELHSMGMLQVEKSGYPRDSSIVDIFKKQVAAHGDVVAVKDSSPTQLTYSELDKQSDRLAVWLRRRRVTPETLIGVLAPRSCETIIAFIGILKANLAYLPLDVSSPAARITDILSSVPGQKLVLVGARVPLSPNLGQLTDVELVKIEDTLRCDQHTSGDEIDADNYQDVQPSATSLAYVMFTSGSTGRPKGARIEHRCILRLVKESNVTCDLPHAATVAHLSNLGFDVSTCEIYMSLLNGGTLICIDYFTIIDAIALGAIFTQQCINAAVISPSLLKQCLASIPEAIGGLDLLHVAGDRFDSRDATQAQKLARGSVYNAYGPTENTVLSTIYRVGEDESFVNGVPIGQPVSNSGAFVMDRNQKQVPLGVMGELVVTGDGLARGYTDPSLDQGRFVHIAGNDGLPVRAYRTGDQVRYRPSDGQIECFGRMDQQIKVRGYRIEPGEIEQALLRNDAIRDAAIVTRNQRREGQALELEMVAFITPRGGLSGSKLETHALKRLRTVLPPYMIPAQIMALDRMPVNASDKVDRRELAKRASTASRSKPNSVRIAPRNEIEAALYEEFTEVLEVKVGVTDSFFDLGGHSIMATKLAARISRRFDVRLSVRDIFQKPVLADLAAIIQQGSARHSPIPSLSYSGPVEQSFAQGRLWFLDQLNAGASWYLMPLTARIRGPLDIDALTVALRALEERHESLRTTFREFNGVGAQVVHPASASKQLRVIDMSADSGGGSYKEKLRYEQTTPFSLATEPGWRVALMRIGKNEYILSIVMHHIISDGWSIDLLCKELCKFYSAARRGENPLNQARPLPIQYRDFAVWQKQDDQVVEQQQQLKYWVKQLSDSQPAELLCDKSRPGVPSGDGGVVQLAIEGQIYEDLQAFCRAQQTTIFNVLLAAFRIAHYRLTGAEDATIGTPVANRNRPELENVIGFFVNTQCIRIAVTGDDTFESSVRQVRATTAEALANQDVPFERIVSEVLPGSGGTSQNPLVQLVFAVHSQLDLGKIQLEDVVSEPVLPAPTTRFDLEFHLFQEENRLNGSVLYAKDLFEPDTIRGVASVFQDVLRHGLAQPQMPIATMPLDDGLDELRTMGLLETEMAAGYPRDSSVVDVFRQQVAAWSAAVAVRDSSSMLTYSQLDQHSDKLAGWLRQQHLAPEALVAVLVPRSCEAIVAFLGILKANLAYLPLDTRMPAARIDSILSAVPRSHSMIMLLGRGVTRPKTKLSDIELMFIADALQQHNGVNGTDDAREDAMPSPSATSLAYCIFTSGSTGKPKGVMVEHRAILRLTNQSQVGVRLPPAARVAHLTNLAFDVSAWEVFMTLLNGGTLVCIDYFTVLDSKDLADVFARQEICVAVFPPALLKQCLAETPNVLGSLDVLFVAGDRFDRRDAIAARAMVRGSVYNAYGPTENGIISTMYAIGNESFVNGVPLGKAIANSGAYIMDPLQRLVPIGVMGELVVTGDGLARGYTDARLDRNRFVQVTVGNQLTTAYRTGDRVRYRPGDGQIEFFGRMDQQVKIRGHRIEPAEVEQAMLGHSAVRDAAVVIRSQQGREPELVGFVAAVEGEDESTEKGEDAASGQVEGWGTHFETSTYASIETLDRSMLGKDFTGWISIYDRKEIDKEAMLEWLDDAVQTILDGRPAGRILEIGTGTGMVLFNLGPGLEKYFGLEPSQSAVAFVNAMIGSMPALSKKAKVQVGTAMDAVGRVEALAFDTVVVNSVAQYFPSADYLKQLIDHLTQIPGVRRLVFGDVRTHAINVDFLASRALYALGMAATKDEIRRKMAEMEEREEELLVDPAFFTRLPSQLADRIWHAEILPKMMKATNELSSYRYTVVLHLHSRERNGSVAPLVHTIPENAWVNFAECQMDRCDLERLLSRASSSSSSDATTIAVSNVPYAKTILERHLVKSLDNDGEKPDEDPHASVDGEAWLAMVGEEAGNCASLSATDLVEIGELAGFRVALSCARQRSLNGALDVVFHRHPATRGQGARALIQFPIEQASPLESLTNRPLQRLQSRRVATLLRERLQTLLPPYMIPAQFIVLDRMPLNANGKVDRRRLTRQARIAPTSRAASERVPPRDKVEAALCDEYANVLGIDVGITDNFFQLGGHSLMAMKLATRITHRLGTSVTVRDIFSQPTPADLATWIQLQQSQGCRAENGAMSHAVRDEHLSFQLLPLYDPQKFIVEEVSPQLGHAHPRVLDIYPATWVQKSFLHNPDTGYPRPPLLFYVNLPADTEHNTLVKTVQGLILHFDIFRTVFVFAAGKFYQVVLEQFEVPIAVINITEDLTSATRALEEADRQRPLKLGQPFLRIAILKQGGSIVRLILRISHALYDGLSFEPILRSFHKLFSGDRLPPSPKFSHYVHHWAQSREQGFKFWRSMLKNSSMTLISGGKNGVKKTASDGVWVLEKAVKTPFQPNADGITQATVFTTACALWLAEETGSSDVLFGRIVSGRQSLPVTSQHVVGPCTNAVPVRVRLDGHADLKETLRSTQDQCINSMPFETLGLDEIKDNCTGWSDATTNYGCCIAYQNFDMQPESQIENQRIRLGHLAPTSRSHGNTADDEQVQQEQMNQMSMHDVYVTAVPEFDGLGLRVLIGVKKHICDEDRVQSMLNGVCEAIQTLNSSLLQPSVPKPPISEMGTETPIYVLGIGNMGAFVAHALKRQHPSLAVTLLFHHDSLVSEWDEAGKAIECVKDGSPIKTTGFNVELVGPSSGTTTSTAPDTPIKYLIVATKSYSTAAAVGMVKHRLGSNSSILFLQNGKGSMEEVSASAFTDAAQRPSFWAGICSCGVYSTSRFSIAHAGRGPIVLGPLAETCGSSENPSAANRAAGNAMIRRLLETPELQTSLSTAAWIREAQLQKLAVNSLVNPLTAIFRCKMGQLLDQPPRLTLLKVLLKETAAIMRSLQPGGPLKAGDSIFSDENLLALVLKATEGVRDSRSSTLQDIEAGRRTEIDYMTGYLASQAKRLGLPCVNNDVLVDMVKQRHVIGNEEIWTLFDMPCQSAAATPEGL